MEEAGGREDGLLVFAGEEMIGGVVVHMQKGRRAEDAFFLSSRIMMRLGSWASGGKFETRSACAFEVVPSRDIDSNGYVCADHLRDRLQGRRALLACGRGVKDGAGQVGPRAESLELQESYVARQWAAVMRHYLRHKRYRRLCNGG